MAAAASILGPDWRDARRAAGRWSPDRPLRQFFMHGCLPRLSGRGSPWEFVAISTMARSLAVEHAIVG
jgi:hypothetical protein